MIIQAGAAARVCFVRPIRCCVSGPTFVDHPHHIHDTGREHSPDGVQSRLGAIVLEGSGSPGFSLNAALAGNSATFFVIMPEGYILHGTFLERCEMIFRDGCAAIAPAVSYQTADGTGEVVSMPERARRRLARGHPQHPPVLAIRRDAWDALNGFDESLPALVEYEFLLRLISKGRASRCCGLHSSRANSKPRRTT